MKKILLITSLIGFIICLVLNLFYVTSCCAGVYTTLLTLFMIGLSIYFLRNVSRLRTWVAVVVFILCLIMIFLSSAGFAKRKYESINKSTTLEETVDETEEVEEEQEIEDNTEEAEKNETEEEEVKETELKNEEKQVVTKIVEKVVEVPVSANTNTTSKSSAKTETKTQKQEEKTAAKEVEKKSEEQISKASDTKQTPPTIEEPVATVEPPAVETAKPVQKNQPTYTYTGDPTGRSYGYNSYGDPTGRNYSYGYSGDPTIPNDSYTNCSQSVRISGPSNVSAGGTYTYTVTGTNYVSRNNLSIPAHVTASISGNTVRLTFEEGYTGSYFIGYGNSSISVTVNP